MKKKTSQIEESNHKKKVIEKISANSTQDKTNSLPSGSLDNNTQPTYNALCQAILMFNNNPASILPKKISLPSSNSKLTPHSLNHQKDFSMGFLNQQIESLMFDQPSDPANNQSLFGRNISNPYMKINSFNIRADEPNLHGKKTVAPLSPSNLGSLSKSPRVFALQKAYSKKTTSQLIKQKPLKHFVLHKKHKELQNTSCDNHQQIGETAQEKLFFKIKSERNMSTGSSSYANHGLILKSIHPFAYNNPQNSPNMRSFKESLNFKNVEKCNPELIQQMESVYNKFAIFFQKKNANKKKEQPFKNTKIS